jgi:hypothetical protein
MFQRQLAKKRTVTMCTTTSSTTWTMISRRRMVHSGILTIGPPGNMTAITIRKTRTLRIERSMTTRRKDRHMRAIMRIIVIGRMRMKSIWPKGTIRVSPSHYVTKSSIR